jgi:RNA polymerase sigma-70 factor, ECF subfamily
MATDSDISPTELTALVFAAQGGDLDAFSQIVMRCSRRVRLVISARAAHAAMVEEVVQAAFVTAFERLKDWQPTGSFVAWVTGIALNHLRHELRRQRRDTSPLAIQFDRLFAPEAEPETSDEALEHHLDRLPGCLERLSPSARTLLTARYQDGLSLDDVAERSGKSANAIAVALHRLRQTLRSCLEQTHGSGAGA